MNKSPLTSRVILAKYYEDRPYSITKFTPHHWAVVGAAAETIANNFDENHNSANYVIGNDGELILCVPEEYMAYTSANYDNDSRAITVEVANETGEPEWRVSDAALETLINLGVDICRRYNLPPFEWTGDANGTLTIHKMFDATACPGPYLESKMPYIAAEIARRLNEGVNTVYTIDLDELKAKGYTKVELILTKPIEEKPIFSVGDKVKLTDDAIVYGTARRFADFIYNTTLYLRELNGERAVISTVPEGAVTGPVDVKYLAKV